MNALQLEHVRLGHILGGGLSDHVIAAVVARHPGETGFVHHDFGAGNHHRPNID
jgi:hypothetical protein